MTSLLRPSIAAVEARGELVLLRLGDCRWTLEFNVALELAAALKVEARAAKRGAGDRVARYSTMGSLTDATAEAPKPSRFRKQLPERLAARNLAVKAEGKLVAISFGATTARMGYSAAIQLAQWLRVRGKEARNAAGEKAHWSEIVTGAVAAG